MIETHFLVKIAAVFVANFQKTVGEEIEIQKFHLWSSTEIVDFETDLKSFYDNYVSTSINHRIDDLELRGSGFSLSEILELNIQISSFDPCSGSAYIPLPKILQSKRAIINVQNKDNECFKYAVLAALCDKTEVHLERATKYKKPHHQKKCDFSGLQYPVDLKQISMFEEKNPSISINVYMFDDTSEKVRPLRLTKQVKTKHIHLLLLSKKHDYDDESQSHYCWIKDLSMLLSAQISKNCHKRFFLRSLLKSFY